MASLLFVTGSPLPADDQVILAPPRYTREGGCEVQSRCLSQGEGSQAGSPSRLVHIGHGLAFPQLVPGSPNGVRTRVSTLRGRSRTA